MNSKSKHVTDLIFKKLKTYQNKKIFLEREHLDNFIFSLLKEN